VCSGYFDAGRAIPRIGCWTIRSGSWLKLRMRTLLLVEDDDAFRYAASRHLTAAGYRVVAARTTMKALMEVDSGRHIDAFLVDVAMPAGNPHGISFARMMHHRRSSTPILLMTAFPDTVRNAELPGKVLFKPITLERLTDAIQALFLGLRQFVRRPVAPASVRSPKPRRLRPHVGRNASLIGTTVACHHIATVDRPGRADDRRRVAMESKKCGEGRLCLLPMQRRSARGVILASTFDITASYCCSPPFSSSRTWSSSPWR